MDLGRTAPPRLPDEPAGGLPAAGAAGAVRPAHWREPDVAFDGNPASGELVLLSGRYGQVGGTSLSAPIFAGAWARILQANPDLGFAAPHLYGLPAAALHDVRAGNNRGYIAGPGWDWVTGLGSLGVGRAAAALAAPQPATPRGSR